MYSCRTNMFSAGITAKVPVEISLCVGGRALTRAGAGAYSDFAVADASGAAPPAVKHL
jgi:hypothetical protein